MKAQTHSLKTWPEYFDAVKSGAKPFEVRKNDRDFQVGDTLILRKFVPPGPSSFAGRLTGAWIKRKVSYILHGPAFGVEAGFCVLGLGKLSKAKARKKPVAHPQTTGRAS